MAEVRIFSFILDISDPSLMTPWTAFEWNDSGDDTALVDWAEGLWPGYLGVSIDAGELSWEQLANGSDTGSFTLTAGTIIRVWKTTYGLGAPAYLESYPGLPDGRWFSDEFGRPFDVNDLQAP